MCLGFFGLLGIRLLMSISLNSHQALAFSRSLVLQVAVVAPYFPVYFLSRTWLRAPSLYNNFPFYNERIFNELINKFDHEIK